MAAPAVGPVAAASSDKGVSTLPDSTKRSDAARNCRLSERASTATPSSVRSRSYSGVRRPPAKARPASRVVPTSSGRSDSGSRTTTTRPGGTPSIDTAGAAGPPPAAASAASAAPASPVPFAGGREGPSTQPDGPRVRATAGASVAGRVSTTPPGKVRTSEPASDGRRSASGLRSSGLSNTASRLAPRRIRAAPVLRGKSRTMLSMRRVAAGAVGAAAAWVRSGAVRVRRHRRRRPLGRGGDAARKERGGERERQARPRPAARGTHRANGARARRFGQGPHGASGHHSRPRLLRWRASSAVRARARSGRMAPRIGAALLSRRRSISGTSTARSSSSKIAAASRGRSPS